MTMRQDGRPLGGRVPENYERWFVKQIGAPAAVDLVALAALRRGERVLDVACGTGVVARLASAEVGPSGTVAGLDVNPGMLEIARAIAPSGARIEWHEASAEMMPLAEASFDAVLCQMGLQFVSDKPAALREMRRVLVPGGRLILSVPGPTPKPFVILGEALARHVGGEAREFVQQVFSLYDLEDIRGILVGAGFREVEVRVDTKRLRLPLPEEFLWQYLGSTPLAGAVARVTDERRASLERDVVEKWQSFVRADTMSFEVRMAVATARK